MLEGGFTAEDGAESSVFALATDEGMGTILVTLALLRAGSSESYIKDPAYRKSRETKMPVDASWG